MVEGAREQSEVSFYRNSNPNHESGALPKALPPNTVAWSIKISMDEFGGDTNIQTVAMSNKKLFFKDKL